MSDPSSPDDTQSDSSAPEHDLRMTLWDHLDELRKRVMRAGLALIVTSLACWVYREPILAWLLVPYENAWVERGLPGTPELQTLAPTDAFVGYMQLSMVGGIVLAVPIIFYQLWSFVSPGLYAREKRFIVPFVVFSSLLFAAGVAFCYYVAFPLFFTYFFSLLGTVSEAGTVLTQRPTLEFYLDFATRLLLAFGFVFELPLFLTFLSMAGIVSAKQLAAFGRWAVLGALILGAIITPGGEVTSQLVMASALTVLYFLSVGLAYVFGKKPAPDIDNDGA